MFFSSNFRSVPLQIVLILLRTLSMHSLFFRNDGIVLDRSARSRERTIVHKEQRPARPIGGYILYHFMNSIVGIYLHHYLFIYLSNAYLSIV